MHLMKGLKTYARNQATNKSFMTHTSKPSAGHPIELIKRWCWFCDKWCWLDGNSQDGLESFEDEFSSICL